MPIPIGEIRELKSTRTQEKMSEKRIVAISECYRCPHERDFGNYCSLAKRQLPEKAPHPIPDWCPLDKYEEKKCISKTQK